MPVGDWPELQSVGVLASAVAVPALPPTGTKFSRSTTVALLSLR